MPKIVDYYFTPVSPFAYLGHGRFVAIATRQHASVNVKPVDLGKVFGVSGGLPLKQRAPQRQAYRLVELERWAVAIADAPDTGARYEALTQEAIGRQVFGAPTYVYRDELFWGQDRLDFLDRELAK